MGHDVVSVAEHSVDRVDPVDLDAFTVSDEHVTAGVVIGDPFGVDAERKRGWNVDTTSSAVP